jgi:hypothetical protein
VVVIRLASAEERSASHRAERYVEFRCAACERDPSFMHMGEPPPVLAIVSPIETKSQGPIRYLGVRLPSRLGHRKLQRMKDSRVRLMNQIGADTLEIPAGFEKRVRFSKAATIDIARKLMSGRRGWHDIVELECPRAHCGHQPGLTVGEMANKALEALGTTRGRRIFI